MPKGPRKTASTRASSLVSGSRNLPAPWPWLNRGLHVRSVCPTRKRAACTAHGQCRRELQGLGGGDGHVFECTGAAHSQLHSRRAHPFGPRAGVPAISVQPADVRRRHAGAPASRQDRGVRASTVTPELPAYLDPAAGESGQSARVAGYSSAGFHERFNDRHGARTEPYQSRSRRKWALHAIVADSLPWAVGDAHISLAGPRPRR